MKHPLQAQKETISCASGLQSNCGILGNCSHPQAKGCSASRDGLDVGAGLLGGNASHVWPSQSRGGRCSRSFFPPVFVPLQGKWLRVTMPITVGILPLTLLVHLHHGIQAWVSMLDQYDSTVFERKKGQLMKGHHPVVRSLWIVTWRIIFPSSLPPSTWSQFFLDFSVFSPGSGKYSLGLWTIID